MKEINIQIPENFAVEEAAKLREELYNLIKEGEKNFIMDFSKCSFIDSTGLGVLVGIYKRCSKVNGKMELHSLNPQIMRVFKLTRLDSVFNIV